MVSLALAILTALYALCIMFRQAALAVLFGLVALLCHHILFAVRNFSPWLVAWHASRRVLSSYCYLFIIVSCWDSWAAFEFGSFLNFFVIRPFHQM